MTRNLESHERRRRLRMVTELGEALDWESGALLVPSGGPLTSPLTTLTTPDSFGRCEENIGLFATPMSYVKIIVSLSSSSNTCSVSIQRYFSSSDRTKTVMRIMRTSICGKLANWVLGGHFNLLTPALMMVHLHRKPVRVTLITFNLLGNVSLRAWWKISLKYSELLSESISPKILMMNNYTPRLFTEMLCVQTPSGPVWVTHSRATGPPRTNIFQEVESSRLIDWSLSGLTKRIYVSDDHHITHNTHNV